MKDTYYLILADGFEIRISREDMLLLERKVRGKVETHQRRFVGGASIRFRPERKLEVNH